MFFQTADFEKALYNYPSVSAFHTGIRIIFMEGENANVYKEIK